ncbi:hypothetical protein M231_06532 [Tremella mesenterica]|uniref:Uncharacterized protein n=1 Tax=Tremella mesenterica TaxID=5217 RepID=A0A4Q1BBJ0_TREME|nr:hypothetical protein M231_06532 [Tremella mesenterica]
MSRQLDWYMSNNRACPSMRHSFVNPRDVFQPIPKQGANVRQEYFVPGTPGSLAALAQAQQAQQAYQFQQSSKSFVQIGRLPAHHEVVRPQVGGSGVNNLFPQSYTQIPYQGMPQSFTTSVQGQQDSHPVQGNYPSLQFGEEFLFDFGVDNHFPQSHTHIPHQGMPQSFTTSVQGQQDSYPVQGSHPSLQFGEEFLFDFGFDNHFPQSHLQIPSQGLPQSFATSATGQQGFDPVQGGLLLAHQEVVPHQQYEYGSDNLLPQSHTHIPQPLPQTFATSAQVQQSMNSGQEGLIPARQEETPSTAPRGRAGKNTSASPKKGGGGARKDRAPSSVRRPQKSPRQRSLDEVPYRKKGQSRAEYAAIFGVTIPQAVQLPGESTEDFVMRAQKEENKWWTKFMANRRQERCRKGKKNANENNEIDTSPDGTVVTSVSSGTSSEVTRCDDLAVKEMLAVLKSNVASAGWISETTNTSVCVETSNHTLEEQVPQQTFDFNSAGPSAEPLQAGSDVTLWRSFPTDRQPSDHNAILPPSAEWDDM